MVKSTEASGGLDTALGALVGATPLSLLGPFAVLQSLTAGAHTGDPAEAGAARLPLVQLLLPHVVTMLHITVMYIQRPVPCLAERSVRKLAYLSA